MNWGARTDHSCSLKRRFNSAFYFESLIPYKCNNPVSGVLTKIMLTVHPVSRSVILNFVFAFHQLFFMRTSLLMSHIQINFVWHTGLIFTGFFILKLSPEILVLTIFWYKCDKFKNTSTQWWINRRRSHWDWKRWDIYLRR